MVWAAFAVRTFIEAHDAVYVVEQNRDAQLRSLLVNEFDLDPARVPAVLHYDGTPITARFIARAIGERLRTANAAQTNRAGAC